jgi:hypothetical protein
MSVRKPLLLIVLAAVLAIPAIALAGHPAPGATYRGKSEKDDRVVFKVNDSGHHMFISVTDPCGTNLKGGGLTIGKNGHFDAVSSSGAEVKGSFVSRRKAVGTIKNKCQDLGERTFVARRS